MRHAILFSSKYVFFFLFLSEEGRSCEISPVIRRVEFLQGNEGNTPRNGLEVIGEGIKEAGTET